MRDADATLLLQPVKRPLLEKPLAGWGGGELMAGPYMRCARAHGLLSDCVREPDDTMRYDVFYYCNARPRWWGQL